MRIDLTLGALYRGKVMHHRRRPVDHRFVYRVFSLWLDIDRLDELAARLRLFAIDRPAPVAFYHRDHGPRDGQPGLRAWVEAQLAQWQRPSQPARIMLLSMPRLLGRMFNPLSVYFCYDETDRLQSVLYEVKNTFGGQHVYAPALATAANGEGGFVHGCDKAFFVSPFIDMHAHYRFRLREPGERLSLAIRETDATGTFFVASHTATRLPLSDTTLFACLLRHGLLSLTVFGGIHYEALRLWLKGAPYFSRDAKSG